MSAYIFSGLITLFLFMGLRDLVMFVRRNEMKFLYIALFFLFFMVNVCLCRFTAFRGIFGLTVYNVFFIGIQIVLSLICVLLGDSYLGNGLVNKYIIGYFIFEVAVFICTLVLLSAGLMNCDVFCLINSLVLFIYSLCGAIFSLVKFIYNWSKGNRKGASFIILMFFLSVRMLCEVLNVRGSIFIFAILVIFVILVELEVLNKNTQHPVESFQDTAGSENNLDLLSEKQKDVAMKIIECKTAKTISGELNISIHMVNKYTHQIYRRLGAANRSDFINKYKKN